MQSFNSQQLDGERLLPLFLRGGDAPSHYLDINHPLWEGDESSFLNQLGEAQLSHRQFVELVYARCSSSTKLKGEPTYWPISLFAVTQKGKRYVWETSVRAQHNAAIVERSQSLRDSNIQFLRMYMTGSPNGRIHCPILNIQIDEAYMWGKISNDFVGHHMRFVNGVSVHKDGQDPGANLSRLDFSQPSPETWKALKDITRTVFMSSTAHDGLHKRHISGDITMYETNQLPVAWQSESNWQSWCQFLVGFGYDHLGNLNDWYSEQVNS